ncbi:MAG: FtsW/RodA/SpoVE family cell cycle protein [Acidobacteria bacterium]|nr:FtsW/RodA/SpoVE family cell cycle protein [Acidobacteriota bacterium]
MITQIQILVGATYRCLRVFVADVMEMKNRPSSHLLIQGVILISTAIADVAIITAAHLRGYEPSWLLAIRDLLALALVIAGFVVLIARFRYRGNLIIYTCVVLLFSIGLIAQFRLFSDPEYTARGDQRAAARLAKAHAVRARAIQEGYDQAKLAYVFGKTETEELSRIKKTALDQTTLSEVTVSGRTFIPLLSLAGLLVAFGLIRREDVLLWIQRHSLLIALATLAPLMLIIVVFTRGGKFLGGMTPWEPAKVLFLFSLSGILVDSYRVLRKTQWGLPPLRFFFPLVITAAFGLVPFFILGDFGQLLVFGIVYTLLYLVAVKRPGQVLPGLAILVLVFMLISAVGGIPDRVKYRYHLWEHTWQPPLENAEWWAPYLERLRATYGQSGSNLSNEDAWFDQGSQLIQAIFGISHGKVAGTGLGLGLPETVPVSDSDFIYAAIAEELGMIGGLSLLLCVLLLGGAGLREAIQAPDMYTKLLAAGVTAFLVFQAFVNMAGVLKLTPMTGITLPFVSHGGWSLLTSLTMVGILMGISHRNAVQSIRMSQS